MFFPTRVTTGNSAIEEISVTAFAYVNKVEVEAKVWLENEHSNNTVLSLTEIGIIQNSEILKLLHTHVGSNIAF